MTEARAATSIFGKNGPKADHDPVASLIPSGQVSIPRIFGFNYFVLSHLRTPNPLVLAKASEARKLKPKVFSVSIGLSDDITGGMMG